MAWAAIPSARPSAPRPSAVVALTFTLGAVDAEVSGDIRADRLAVGREPRLLRDQDQVAVRDHEAAGGDQSHHLASSARLSAPAKRGSSFGKCVPMSPSPAAPSSASISACRSTSPSECATSPGWWRSRTPPRHDVIAWTEAMHVVAAADSHRCLPSTASAAFANGRSAGRVTLMLSARALDQPRPQTQCFSIAAASSVGLRALRRSPTPAHAAAVRSGTSAVSAPARALATGQRRPAAATASACFSVSTTGSASRPPTASRGTGRDQGPQVAAGQAGPRSIVNQHPVGIIGRVRAPAARAAPSGRASRPPFTVNTPRRNVSGRRGETPIARREDHDASGQARAGGDGPQRVLEDAPAGDAQPLLGYGTAEPRRHTGGRQPRTRCVRSPAGQGDAWVTSDSRPGRVRRAVAAHRRPGRRSRSPRPCRDRAGHAPRAQSAPA